LIYYRVTKNMLDFVLSESISFSSVVCYDVWVILLLLLLFWLLTSHEPKQAQTPSVNKGFSIYWTPPSYQVNNTSNAKPSKIKIISHHYLCDFEHDTWSGSVSFLLCLSHKTVVRVKWNSMCKVPYLEKEIAVILSSVLSQLK
jgi:hypothetical protein